jgi:hypothetical protein
VRESFVSTIDIRGHFNMKNQYFGDLNDYRKYGLLRILSGFGEISTAICWMLTLDDNTNHGGSIHYLDMPKVWRPYDPELFDILRAKVLIEGQRDLRMVKEESIVSNAHCYLKAIPEDPNLRAAYFSEFLEMSKTSNLIFLDPDNGLEIKSKPYGRKGSSKFLYWKEVRGAYDTPCSVLFYQHFPRENRDAFIGRIVVQLLRRTAAKSVYSFETSTVAYFLIPSRQHTTYFWNKSSQVCNMWFGQFAFRGHTVRDIAK